MRDDLAIDSSLSIAIKRSRLQIIIEREFRSADVR